MSEARDRLLQAIKDVDAETFGERPANQVLTNYVVITSHRHLDDDPEGDSDALSRISMPGQALWQTLGLLDGGTIYIREQIRASIGDEDD